MSTIHRFLGNPTNNNYTWVGVDLMDGRWETEDGLSVLGPRSSVSGDIHQLTNTGDTPLGFLCAITHQAEYA